MAQRRPWPEPSATKVIRRQCEPSARGTSAVHAITTKDFPTMAERPANSRADLSHLRQVFGVTTPPWQQAPGANSISWFNPAQMALNVWDAPTYPLTECHVSQDRAVDRRNGNAQRRFGASRAQRNLRLSHDLRRSRHCSVNRIWQA
jgi:hypothetical protein